jgi:uncharacterized membrane protein
MAWTTLVAPDTAAASSYNTVMDHIAQAFEVLGTLILAIGVLWSFALAVLAWRRSRSGQRAYKAAPGVWRHAVARPGDPGRRRPGQDRRRCPTLNKVLVLGLIVLIRTFLSFSLEIEIDGTWPWRRALASGAGTVKQATQVALEPGSH